MKSFYPTLAIAVGFVCILSIRKCSAWSTENQSAQLYDDGYCVGNCVSLNRTYDQNLTDNNFRNKTKSVHVTGAWIFYEKEDYNADGVGRVEFVFGPNNWCANLKSLSGRVNSVRFVGAPKNYKTNSLTLFRHKYFQGTEEYTLVALPNLHLDKKASSLIVTGLSPWTLYALPNYLGDAICVYPPPLNPFLPAFTTDLSALGIPTNSIRSVKPGCSSTTITTILPLYSGYN